jgi:hypothetical protein
MATDSANTDASRGGEDVRNKRYVIEEGKMNLKKYAYCMGIAAATLLVVSQPANALLKNTFEFTDNYGSGAERVPGQKVKGEIIFNSLNPGQSATGVAADSLIVTEVPDFLLNTWGDEAGFSLNRNLLLLSNTTTQNFFDVLNGKIKTSYTYLSAYDGLLNEIETIGIFISRDSYSSNYSNFSRFYLEDYKYFDSEYNYAEDYTSTAAVPFEFSPSLGLVMMVGGFGITRLRQKLALRKTLKEV